MVLDHSVSLYRSCILLSTYNVSLATTISSGKSSCSFTFNHQWYTSDDHSCYMAIHQNTQITRFRRTRIYQLWCTSTIGLCWNWILPELFLLFRYSKVHVFVSRIYLVNWINWFFHLNQSLSIILSSRRWFHIVERMQSDFLVWELIQRNMLVMISTLKSTILFEILCDRFFRHKIRTNSKI